jgi:ribosomal protein L16 Arg81 hydroxylase
MECILEPGDTLFMPSGFWHYITYLEGGFSVSYRKLAYSLKTKLQGFLSLVVYMPLDKLINLIVGPKWLLKKERIAEAKANKAIQRIKEGYDKPMPVQQLQHQHH